MKMKKMSEEDKKTKEGQLEERNKGKPEKKQKGEMGKKKQIK